MEVKKKVEKDEKEEEEKRRGGEEGRTPGWGVGEEEMTEAGASSWANQVGGAGWSSSTLGGSTSHRNTPTSTQQGVLSTCHSGSKMWDHSILWTGWIIILILASHHGANNSPKVRVRFVKIPSQECLDISWYLVAFVIIFFCSDS